MSIIIFTIVLVSTIYAGGFATELSTPTTILPFEYDCATSSGWSFVGVNLAFGSLSFGQAKAIDLAWNWVVGRGYQGILSIAAYRVFTDALLRATELTALPIELYATLALPSTKLTTLYQLSKNLFRFGNWRIKYIFAWLFLSTIYLIAVPGLLDAATAYEASVKTSFRFANNTIANVEDLKSFSQYDTIATFQKVCMTYQTPEAGQYFGNPREGAFPGQYLYAWDYSDFQHFSWTRSWCASRDFDGKLVASTGMYEHNSTQFNLFDWKDSALNKSYYDQLALDPMSVFDTRRWAEWKFAPMDRDNYNCDMDDRQYRVSSPSTLRRDVTRVNHGRQLGRANQVYSGVSRKNGYFSSSC